MILTRMSKLMQAAVSRRALLALVRHRVLMTAEHRTVLSAPWNLVVDIGANRGQFTLAVKRWAPQALVIAFEPLEKPARKFRAIFGSDHRVVLHSYAIAPFRNSAQMHISKRDDSSSLLPITDLQSELFSGTEEESLADVSTAPLDQFISKQEISGPALLKLDVQGFELQALQGCENLLSVFDEVYCECSFVELYAGQSLASDVIQWLGSRGFRLKGVYNLCYDTRGAAVQGDFLFVNE